MDSPRTLLDRVLWRRVLSDSFHEKLQAEYDNAVAHHHDFAYKEALKGVVEECGRIVDEYETAKSLTKLKTHKKDYERRQEGVLRVKDRLMEMMDDM